MDGDAEEVDDGTWMIKAGIDLDRSDGGPTGGTVITYSVAGATGTSTSGRLRIELDESIDRATVTIINLSRDGATYDPSRNNVSSLTFVRPDDD
jgi:hypothetical protein